MADRITHLDTVRGAAVLGILVMNSVSFAFGNIGYFDISTPAATWPLDPVVGALGEVFADQKFMALFSLLFGASLLLFLDRVGTRTARPVRLSLWRNALLLVIGILHSLAWVGDVLVVYALCAPVLVLLRGARARVLVGLGVSIYALSIGSAWLLGGVDDTSIRAVWDGAVGTPAEEWAGLLMLVDMFSRSLGMMLVGMGLYRSGFLRRPLPARGLATSVVAIAAGAVLSGGGLAWVASQGFDAAAISRGNTLNGVATVPMALGYLGLLMAWDRRASGPWVVRVRALGRMALTNYLGQTAIGLTLAALVPAAWVSRATVWVAILVVWLLQLLASEAWLRSFRMGPVEWLWRCATYRRREPFRRRVPAPAAESG